MKNLRQSAGIKLRDERKWENTISGKQLDSNRAETRDNSVTEVNADRNHNRLLLLQKRGRRLTEEKPWNILLEERGEMRRDTLAGVSAKSSSVKRQSSDTLIKLPTQQQITNKIHVTQRESTYDTDVTMETHVSYRSPMNLINLITRRTENFFLLVHAISERFFFIELLPSFSDS